MNSVYTVRSARLEDVEVLPEIEKSAARAFLQIPELAWIADDDIISADQHKIFAENRASWVAQYEPEQKQVGFLCASIIDGQMHIEEIAVCMEHQQKGVGRLLIEQAYRAARERGLKALTLTTFIHVPWNAPWYTHLGFKQIPFEHLPHRLRMILLKEQEHGLVLSQRCAMIRQVNRGTAQ